MKYRTKTINKKLAILKAALKTSNLSKSAKEHNASRQNLNYWKKRYDLMIHSKNKFVRRNIFKERTKNKDKESNWISSIRNACKPLTKEKLSNVFFEIYPKEQVNP